MAAAKIPGEAVQPSQATIAVHGGVRPEQQPLGSVVSPVFHSSTYSFQSFDEMRRYARGELPEVYFYSRYENPTVAEVERKIAELEGAEAVWSHTGYSEAELRAAGVSSATVRFAIGIESVSDIIADVTQALDKI